MSQDVVSFVLRFIREQSNNGQPARWRGVIRHVQSDQAADFSRFSDALAFMQAHVDDAIQRAFSGEEPLTPDRMLAETARLWGELAPRYTDIVLQSMGLMLDQGRRMSERMAENMAAWRAQGPEPSREDRLIAAIERLTDQVATLTARVEELEAQLRENE
jgi:hypothetical protein